MALTDILFFALGLGLLIGGAWVLISGGTRVAAVLGLPPVVIGLTVVAFGTSAPELFVSILGAESGNLALKTLATGGVYLGGGIPPRILPALNSGTFIQSFQDKGRFREFMTRLPVHVILNSNAALLGAARCGLEA